MLRPEDFSVAVRRGARCGTRRLVLHFYAGDTGDSLPVLVGVVVPKKQVARATHRNRIKRRIREIMKERVDFLETGTKVVVRGLAGADGATSEEIARDLDFCLSRTRQSGRRR